jgi:hypothetical protein
MILSPVYDIIGKDVATVVAVKPGTGKLLDISNLFLICTIGDKAAPDMS